MGGHAMAGLQEALRCLCWHDICRQAFVDFGFLSFEGSSLIVIDEAHHASGKSASAVLLMHLHYDRAARRRRPCLRVHLKAFVLVYSLGGKMYEWKRASTLKSQEHGLEEEFNFKGTHGIARYQLTHSQFGKFDGRRALREAEEELRRRREEERKAREGEERREAYRWLEGSHLFKPTPSPPTLPRPGFRTAVFAPASDVEESFQGRRTDCETPGTPLLQSACRRSSSAKETSSVSKGATQITGALECARFCLAQNVSLHGVLGGQDAPARAREGNPRRRPKGSQARSGAGSSPMTRVETRCSGKAR